MSKDTRRKSISLQQLKKEQVKRKIEVYHGVSLKSMINTD